MNNMVSFFVGCVTFALMFILKIPIKKLNLLLAKRCAPDRESQYRFYRRCNFAIIIMTMVVSYICYGLVLQWLGDNHFKLCCTFKAGAIAIAFYSVYEQWFGEDTQW